MPQGPDGLPNLEDLPSVEVLERLLVLADEASGLKSEREKFLQEAREKLEKAIESEHRASVLLGALRYTIVTPLSKLKKVVMPAEGTLTSDPPPEPAAAGATATTTTTTTTTASAISPRLAAMLALVGLASFAVAAGYSNRSEAHTVPSPSAIAKAREAMMRGDHTDALGYYKKIPNATPDELFHMAECQFRTNDYEAALETCCRIDFDTGGTSWSAPLVRGWIAERRGHKILAVTWYTQSAERGNPGAKKLAERVK